MIKLRCLGGPLLGQDFSLDENVCYRLGRDPELADGLQAILLPSQTVSKNHAELFFKNGQWRVRDLKSFNGLRVNKKKIREGLVRPGDHLDLGEFRFTFESMLGVTQIQLKKAKGGEEATVAGTPVSDEEGSTSKTPRASGASLAKEFLFKAKNSFESLDFKIRIFILFAVSASILHFVVFQSLSSEAKHRFLDESRKNALLSAQNLGEKSKMSLAGGNVLVECEGFGRRDGVEQAFVLNQEGAVLCPVGANVARDELFLEALRTHERQDTCARSLQGNEGDTCEVIYPVSVLKSGQNVPEVVGFVRILFEPLEFNRAVQKFSQIRIQTFILVLIFNALLALVLLWWVRKGIQGLTEEVHLLYTGTAQSVERLQSFAAFDDLIEEINRLISKVNQRVIATAEGGGGEAGFLQTLLDQVFLLEERAVMAVDPDNQVLAISGYLRDILPIRENPVSVHITEAVEDTHLQSELMAFLNELSGSHTVTDKALSATDRILQVRGMPILNQGRHVASLLFFYSA